MTLNILWLILERSTGIKGNALHWFELYLSDWSLSGANTTPLLYSLHWLLIDCVLLYPFWLLWHFLFLFILLILCITLCDSLWKVPNRSALLACLTWLLKASWKMFCLSRRSYSHIFPDSFHWLPLHTHKPWIYRPHHVLKTSQYYITTMWALNY